LGQSVGNELLSLQTEALLNAIRFAGILDIDYRFDRRDGQYKLLDFNPRIGAQFRLFEDRVKNDVARMLYLDLTGQPVRRSAQIDGRIFIVEPYDILASLSGFWNRELTVRDWWLSFRGEREFAWFKCADPIPFVVMWMRLLLTNLGKAARRIGRLLR
jgi:predicted ATP-grasp superfamily ATP-dependent carboligase